MRRRLPIMPMYLAWLCIMYAQTGLVVGVAAGDQHDIAGRRDGHFLEHLRHVADQHFVGVGETFAVGVEQPVVDDGHEKIQNLGDLHQRHGDMAGADDDQLRRRRHDFEEYFELAACCRGSASETNCDFSARKRVSLSSTMASITRASPMVSALRLAVAYQDTWRRARSCHAALDFDHRREHRGCALLGDLNELFGQRAHLPPTAS